MYSKLRSLLRITAVKLSIAYTLAFAILAVIVVVYMTRGAVGYLRQQLQTSINEEVASLKTIYDQRGFNVLVREMARRAQAPGANLYVISDLNGQIVAGNIRDLEPHILQTDG